MRRSIATTALVFAALSAVVFAQQPSVPAGTNSITVVLPSLQNLYDDLKVPFELAKDPKGYETLVDVLEVFVVGVDRKKPVGIRVLSSPDGLRNSMSLPVDLPAKGVVGDSKTDPNYKKLRDNLWDLDLKTAPPPSPAYIRQIPTAIRTRAASMGLTAGERLMFGGREGVMGRDATAVHIAKELSDLRTLKGLVPFKFPEGVDLAVVIDGKSQKPEVRLKAFAKARTELLGASKKRADESETAFALREAALRQLVAELERFYAESAEIQLLVRVDNSQRNASTVLDLTPLPMTELAQSADLVRNESSKYALISSQDAAISFTSRLPLDPLRKKHAAELQGLVKEHVHHLIDSDANKEAAQKDADKQALGLLFEAIGDVAEQAELTGCLRSWSTGKGRFDTLGVLQVPDSAKYLQLLTALTQAAGPIAVTLNADQQADVEIHKLVSPGAKSSFSEIISSDGSIYIGLAKGELWYASGDGVLPRLKQAITESRGQVGAPSDPLTVSVRVGPLVEFSDSYTKRNPLPVKPKGAAQPKEGAKPAPKPAAGRTEGGSKRPPLPAAPRDNSKSPMENLNALFGDMDLLKIARESYTGQDDLVVLKMTRVDEQVRVESSLDTGLIRFLGNVMSKFVKDNLADE